MSAVTFEKNLIKLWIPKEAWVKWLFSLISSKIFSENVFFLTIVSETRQNLFIYVCAPIKFLLDECVLPCLS